MATPITIKKNYKVKYEKTPRLEKTEDEVKAYMQSRQDLHSLDDKDKNQEHSSHLAVSSVVDRFVFNAHYLNPQYKYPTIFKVQADIQFDIYHLFAYGKNKMPIYYDLAYIPNYKSSIMMNGLFRNIRENNNLDFIEESDDEEDFQNMAIDKYVDINKTLLMEFTFNSKFKRWVPIKVVDSRFKVVHISQL